MASAAYWIGSAADKVYIGNNVTTVGSIGVITSHMDTSKAEEKAGLKTTEIYAGRYKRIASQYAPLTDEGKAVIQEGVDYVYSVFVNAVAAHRGVSEKEALAMADGRVFTGKQAISAGLVDGVSTLSAIITDIKSGGVSDYKTKNKETAMNKENDIKADVKTDVPAAPVITAEYLAGNHKDIYDGIKAMGFNEGKIAGAEEGAKAEQERIQGVKDQSITGHEALIESLMFDGHTTGEQAAVAVLKAEREMRVARHKNYKQDGALNISNGEGVESTAMSRKEFNSMNHAERAGFVRNGGKISD